MEHSITPGTKLGPYELIAPLGAGGMGVVYEARDIRLNRHAAVKVLPADATRDFHCNERFEQEARAASALNHPNILTVFDFGEQDGIHYIATELVVGRTLRRVDRASMDLHEVVRIAAEVANGLAAAHTAGIVHRDIKPDNIMVRPDGYVKILDFGLAKLISMNPLGAADTTLTVGMAATQPGAFLGTLSYMSPEQARGLPVDARTDVWSLAVIMYELVSGDLPFRGNTSADTVVSILHHTPPSLRSLRDGIPEELSRIVSKAMEKRPGDRYPSAADMAIDLKHLLRQIEVNSQVSRNSAVRLQSSSTHNRMRRRQLMLAVVGVTVRRGCGRLGCAGFIQGRNGTNGNAVEDTDQPYCRPAHAEWLARRRTILVIGRRDIRKRLEVPLRFHDSGRWLGLCAQRITLELFVAQLRFRSVRECRAYLRMDCKRVGTCSIQSRESRGAGSCGRRGLSLRWKWDYRARR